MQFRLIAVAAAGVLAGIVITGAARAQAVGGPANTGFGGDGLQSSGLDTSWYLVNGPDAALNQGSNTLYTGAAVIGDGTPDGYGSATGGPWLSTYDNGAGLSNWINANDVTGQSGCSSYACWNSNSAGLFYYQTSFTLSSYQASSFVLTGLVAADNAVTEILVNGVATGFSANVSFTSFTSFNLTGSDFLAGNNTITFVVDNAAGGLPNPEGLNVQFTEEAVPEPASLALLGMGLLGLGLAARRRHTV